MRKDNVGLIVLGAVLVMATACSAWNRPEDNTWRTSSFQNSDRVWAAIEMSLVDLDYSVEESNRQDGTIRAKSTKGDVAIILAIDQTQRTQDQVNVFVRPADGGGSVPAGQDELDSAATAFMKILEKKLGN